MNDLILQRPATSASGKPALFLLFHGVGANTLSMQGVGSVLGQWYPEAWIVSVQAPFPSDLGAGWQWFSVRGVTPDNRALRTETAMPAFLQAIARWQEVSGVDPAQTTLLGFSQGAIMALASSQQQPSAASCVVALAGRFPQPPSFAASSTRFHLLHGEADGVVPTSASVEAYAELQALGAKVTLDLLPGLGHGVDDAMLLRLRGRLAAKHREP